METKEYGDLISKAKYNKEDLLEVITLLSLLLHAHSRKLFFMEYEDAKQELTLALIEAIKNIPQCKSDGECLSYLKNAVKFRFSYLCKKNIKKETYEDTYADEFKMETLAGKEEYADLETRIEWQQKIKKIPQKQQQIFQYLISGYSDKEIAQIMGVSRQYINRIKKKWRNI